MKTWLTSLALLLTLSIAHADIQTVEKNLKNNFPDIAVQSVKTTQLKDIYEVYMGGRIVYTNDDATLFLVGHLIDLKAQKNLTEESEQILNSIDVKTLALDQAIKHVKGNGERTLYIFSDPDCPYCQKLEKELVKINNVTIYLFLYPIASLHPNAVNISKQIWCSKDPYQAWQNYVFNSTKPLQSTNCKTPVDQNIQLAHHLNISGTPSFFLKNGRRISGALSAEQIESLLKTTQ